jgi:xanthine dehydrogenase iron-sulfur cluster and FAD-binding subunit A
VHEVQRRGAVLAAYHQPATLGEALDVLAEHGGRARPIAGGTDLLLELARGARPGVDTLVDLSRIPELHGVAIDGDALVIGAATTQGALLADDRVARHALPLAQALLELGAAQLRNRATVVGNVVTASPANDTISALLALGAAVQIHSADRRVRTVPLDDFVTGFRTVALATGELVTSLRVPVLGARRGVFAKLGLRKAQAISVVHGAAVLAFEPDGRTVADARIALGSVAATVVRCRDAEAALAGRPLEEAVAASAAAARAAVVPIDDIRAPAGYRAETVEVLVARMLSALAEGRERERWPARPAVLHDVRRSTPPTPALPVGEHRAGTTVRASVNGADVAAPGDPGQTLLDWLRDAAGLTGTKEGCAEGECGSCTVLLDGQPVLACLVPAPRAAGAEVVTVEGLGGRHPVQDAFVEAGAVQCGFCTPGFVMAAASLVDRVPDLTVEEARHGLAGNLCRCTGYAAILDAVRSAAAVTQAGKGVVP